MKSRKQFHSAFKDKMKEKTVYVCGECGYETPRWMGKCPQCGSWNTLIEEEKVSVRRSSRSVSSKASPLQSVSADAQQRKKTGIDKHGLVHLFRFFYLLFNLSVPMLSKEKKPE